MTRTLKPLTLAVLCMSMWMSIGCSTTPAKSKSFNVDPAAPDPTVRVNWSSRIDDFEFFTRIPVQFAKPKHVASSDELVVGTANGEVIKYQAANGAVLWRKWVEASISAQPGAGGGLVFIADLSGKLHALDLHNGEQAWEFQATSSFETAPTVAEGRVLITDATDTLYALDVATGEELWRYQRPVPEYFTIQGSGLPRVESGEVYCGFADGSLVALQLETGELLWQADLSGGAEKFMDIDGEIFVKDDRIYASSYSGGVYAIDRVSGEIVWRNRLGSVARLEMEEFMLYASSALGRVVAIDSEDGKSTWGFKFQSATPDALKAYGPYLLVATEQPVYILDRTTGYPLHIYKGTAGYSSGMEFGADRLYFFSDHGRITALKLGW